MSFAVLGASAGRMRKRRSMGVAMNRSALLATYPLPILEASVSSFSSFSRVVPSLLVMSQLRQSFFGAAMRVNS